MSLSLKALADATGGTIQGGDPNILITGIASLPHAASGTISFLANPLYRRYLAQTKASVVILAPKDREHCPVTALVVEDPYVAYAQIAKLLAPPVPAQQGIHPTAWVHPKANVSPSAWVGPFCTIEAEARLDEGVQLGPHCVILEKVTLGAYSRLIAHITVSNATIGQRAMIHPGVVIGADGFGLAWQKERWLKVPQLGQVIIGDDVEIGANTTIDRGALGDTMIGSDVKLDNQIQIAHNVQIGDHTAIAGCTGIAGSAVIGQRCLIGGGVGVLGHITITDDVRITGMTFVSESIHKAGSYSSGTILESTSHWQRNTIRFKQLDDLARRLQKLEKAMASKG